jgi:hypothetical protein
VLDQARREHGVELAKGMAWLEAARSNSLVERLLAASAGGA